MNVFTALKGSHFWFLFDTESKTPDTVQNKHKAEGTALSQVNGTMLGSAKSTEQSYSDYIDVPIPPKDIMSHEQEKECNAST